MTLRVWPGDVDANIHMNNGRYQALADLGRISWFLRSGVLTRAGRQRALPVVSDVVAKFRRELRLWQPFVIETRLAGWEQRYLFLEHRFLVGGRVVGLVAVRCVFKAGRRTIYPGELLGSLSARDQSPPLPAWLNHFNDTCEELSTQLRRDELGPESAASAADRQRMN